MKIIVFTVFIFISFSCISLKSAKKPVSAINIFEQSLGKENTRFLNRMLHRFENLLCERYGMQDVNGAYRMYIHEMDSTVDFSFLQKTLKGQTLYKEMRKNDLAREIWLVPDSCWFVGKVLHIRYIYNNDTILSKGSVNKYNNDLTGVDSLTHECRSSNLYGLYYQSLKLAGNYHPFVKDFVEITKNAMSYPDPALMLNAFVDTNFDFSDYFARRLIMINIFFFDLRW